MSNKKSHFGTVALLIAIIAALAVVLTILGGRFALWEPVVSFRLVQTYLSPIAFGVLFLSAFGLIYQMLTKNLWGIIKLTLTGLIGIALITPILVQQTTSSADFPAIHDISTDTTNPPAFKVLNDQRAGAKNSLIYAGNEIATQQKQAYPDIAPIQTNSKAAVAFKQAMQVAEKMGWQMIDVDQQNFRFEASARTPIYGFVDDVVVVVTPKKDSSQIDIRSVSRVGKGDKGMNAQRIRAFISRFPN